MTQHDTPEAVDAMARFLDADATYAVTPSISDHIEDAAAMLRRLHQRAMDAERDMDQAVKARDNWMFIAQQMERMNATARADALREAAEVVGRMTAHWPHVGPVPASVRGEWAARDKIKPAILALIPQEKPHDR